MSEATDRPEVVTAIRDLDNDGQDEVVLDNGCSAWCSPRPGRAA